MTLIFVTEARFKRDGNGDVFSETGSYSLKLWERYLTVFSKVVVIGRVADTTLPQAKELLASSDDVSFVTLPYYVGLLGFIKNRHKIISILKDNANPRNCYICRVPGVMGSLMARILKSKKIPFGVEVVGDPMDVFTKDNFKSILTPLIRFNSCSSLRRVVMDASAALYVTKEQLQKRYPARTNLFTTNASNVILKDNLVLDSPKVFCKDKDSCINILSVGYLEQMYKAPDVAIEVIMGLRQRGYNCKLLWAGDGRYRNDMISMVEKYGLTDYVNFIGRVNPEEVRNYLLSCDIFMHISRTEGLPRAVIEAMGAGLPCVGTAVGGIPELLEDSVLTVSDNATSVADIIESFIKDNNFANSQAERNLAESRLYVESVLKQRRIDFYTELVRLTEANNKR